MDIDEVLNNISINLIDCESLWRRDENNIHERFFPSVDDSRVILRTLEKAATSSKRSRAWTVQQKEEKKPSFLRFPRRNLPRRHRRRHD